MELEQLMARARHRAHYKQARERRRIEKQQQQTRGSKRQPAKAEASILRFAAAPAARVSAQGTQLLLPDSVLDMVMARLASCLEPGGVYGPSLVARDLANASLVRPFACLLLLLLLLLLTAVMHAEAYLQNFGCLRFQYPVLQPLLLYIISYHSKPAEKQQPPSLNPSRCFPADPFPASLC
jgi:hypothetical protein